MADVKVKDPRDIQGAHEDHFNGVKQAEQMPGQSYVDAGTDQAEAFANDPANAIRGKEESGAGSDANWQVNRDASAADASSKQPQTVKGIIPNIAKKGGMPIAIISILLGGGGIIGFFGGAGTLIVNLAEVMVNKFDYQTSTMEVRNRAIIKTKLSGVTDGCKTLSFKCKFGTFSDKELKNLKKQGIEPVSSEKSFTGRNKVTKLKFKGAEIGPGDFVKTLKSNPGFANAMHGAYNMKFLSKWDSIWGKIETKFKISKKAPFDENMTDEERAKKIKEDTKNGKIKTDLTAKCADPKKCTAKENADAESEKASKAKADALTESGAGEDNKASSVLDEMKSGGGAGKIGLSVLKITGVVDTVCMVAGWVNIISATAKTVRLAQMIRYGMIFLTTASMIKAGVATPEDVAYLGTILTMVVKSNSGGLSKSATDSFGYRFAAFGDSGIDNAASMAVAGGSFGGTIEQSVSKIYSFTPGGKKSVKTTCGILSNPFVQAGSLAAGIGGLFIGVTEAKVVAQAALMAAIAFVAPFLAAYLGELLAGDLVKSTTYGEESGNFITSASGGLLGQAANFGGGSVLHKDQATAFLQTHKEVAASYADYDRSVLSPLDASNPNTFLGSMFTQFAPYLYSSDTPMAMVRNLASIVTSSGKNVLSPSVSADAVNTSECHDIQYEELDIAADPFCNPIVGIPPQYMGVDPVDAQNSLKSKGLVDDDGKPVAGGSVTDTGLSYPDFIAQCMQREQPYGLDDPTTDKSDKCFIDSQDKANAYVHAVDMRVSDVDNPTSDSGKAPGPGTPAGDFVFYKQGGDTPWGPTTYIDNTYGYQACFPTAMAMVIATLKDKSVTPATVGDYMRQQGSAGSFDPFDASVGPSVLEHFGVKSTGFGYGVSSSVKDQIIATLKAGGYAIVSGAGGDPFTGEGHYIVLRSITADGQIMTGNPAGFDDTRPYSQDQIFSQYHSATIIPKQ